MQSKKIRAIIKHAYENVPFYHRKFNKAGIKPHDIQSTTDLSKIPITTKSEIQACSLRDIVASNVDPQKFIKKTTSGSTGLPLTIISDEKVEDFNRALYARALLEDGVKISDSLVNIRDPRYFPRSGGFLERVARKIAWRINYVSVFDNPEKQLELLEVIQPSVISGYSSSLAILADFCKKKAIHIHPRLIFTGAELLNEGHRNLIRSAFKCELFDYHACIEFSLLMWQCRDHTGYHMNTDSIAIDFIKNGAEITPGERGEMICTTLVNYTMPLIRYRLGDVGIPTEEQCSCGISLPLVKKLEGRTDDFLTTLDGRLLSPSAFFPYPFETLDGIRQIRVIQARRDKLTIQLVLKASFPNTEQTFENARTEIERVFGEGMRVDFQVLKKIEQDSTGKLKKIISRVPVALGV
jgi:phenylacetate-CoA ligase